MKGFQICDEIYTTRDYHNHEDNIYFIIFSST